MSAPLTEWLNPDRRLVDEVADWLAARAEPTPQGAASLARFMVVVPTAQSGRSLRLALARRFGARGVLPPKIAMTGDLLVQKDVRTATETEELAAMAGVLLDAGLGDFRNLLPPSAAERGAAWAIDMAGRLLEISSLLGERALLMSDVKCPEDAARWCDLAEAERRLFAAVEKAGAVPRAVSRRNAAAAGCLEDGVEEIVLPAAVDIPGAFEEYLGNSRQKIHVLLHARKTEADAFDAWGRPVREFASPLKASSVVSAPNAVAEADDIARVFRAVDPGDELPALAVCDAEMHPELEGAFQNHFSEDELVLRNPARSPLATSPLGRLFSCVLKLSMDGDYETFSTFLRTGDAARWAASALSESPSDIALYVGALDAVQNAHLPQTLDEAAEAAGREAASAAREADRSAAAGLARLARAVKAELADPFAFVGKMFASLRLDGRNPADRELAAAAEAVRGIRESCSSDLVPARLRGGPVLFLKLLERTAYMLEPVAPHVLSALGWLEVPWCAADELVIAGFNEGCVPSSVVGHPFVPDSLRASLGLSTNASRAMRDSFIFAEAVRCRAPGAVTVHLHQVAGDRNVMKPSRLLFPGVPDGELPAFARRLYVVTKGSGSSPAKEIPPAWRLKLPRPPEGVVYRRRISVTALDSYLHCPFGFFLRETFGERADDRACELDARAFGTLCHDVLDEFAKSDARDSADAGEIADFLHEGVRRRLAEFGTVLPAVVELQGDAAAERLRWFAALQAGRRAEGWRIVSSERSMQCTLKGRPTVISGRIDRIDEHEATGELAIIDYKTWRNADRIGEGSVQLPVYRAMVEASGMFDAGRARSARALYCILAEREEDTAFRDDAAFGEGGQSEAEDAAAGLLDSIARGIFYPPKNDDWRAEYGSLAGGSLEECIDGGWLDDQKRRVGFAIMSPE